MRKLFASFAAVTLLSVVVTASLSAAPPKARPPVRAAEAYQTQVVAVPEGLMQRVGTGRNIEGTVTFAPTMNGHPQGSATEICSRMDVTARKFNELGTWNSTPVLRSAKGKPVDPADYTKGCTYKLASLPANVVLITRVVYQPPIWSMPFVACTDPPKKAAVVTTKVMTLSFPDAAITIKPLDLVLDQFACV